MLNYIRNPYTMMLLNSHIECQSFRYGDDIELQLLDETNIPSGKYISTRINNYISSKKYKEAILAEKYYGSENEDILKKRRIWIDKLGTIHEDKLLANNKIAHPTLRTIVNKKANMALAKPVIANSNDPEINDILKGYFTKKFASKLCQMAKKNYLHGKDWMYATYVNGKLEFKLIDGINVIDTWSDMDHDSLDKLTEIIWFWTSDYIDANGVTVEKNYAKVFRKTGIYNYESTTGYGYLNYVSTESHMNIDGVNVLWNGIPWVPFSAYADETSLIRPLKSMIDAYDRTVSSDADTLDDMPKAVHVLKGYGGEDAEQIVQRIHEQRTILLDVDGEYDPKTITVDLTQSNLHLDRLNSDIYSASAAVDSANTDLGNTSGIAIKLRYQDAIYDANELMTQYQNSLEMVMQFILADIKLQYTLSTDSIDVEFIFDMDLAIDEKEISDIIKNSDYLSMETRIANHPYVKDVQKEMERLNPTNVETVTNIDNGNNIIEE